MKRFTYPDLMLRDCVKQRIQQRETAFAIAQGRFVLHIPSIDHLQECELCRERVRSMHQQKIRSFPKEVLEAAGITENPYRDN